jgi:hypothetical protein
VLDIADVCRLACVCTICRSAADVLLCQCLLWLTTPPLCFLPACLAYPQVSGRTFTPAVIEPSFGIGRIMYCMFEHAFYSREVRALFCSTTQHCHVNTTPS